VELDFLFYSNIIWLDHLFPISDWKAFLCRKILWW